MKAVRIHEHGGADVLVWEEISNPVIKPDQALVYPYFDTNPAVFP